MYTFRCDGIVREFRDSEAAMRGCVRHAINLSGHSCHEQHTIYHDDTKLGQTAELPFIELGFYPEYVLGLAKPQVRNNGWVWVPGQFFAVSRKYKDHPSLQKYAA